MSTATQHKQSHQPREFLVTTFARKPSGRDKPSTDILWSEVWHTEGPLPLGYPFRWVLQKSGDCLRIRDLGEPSAREIAEPVDDIPLADLSNRGFIEVGQGKRKCWVLIQPVQELRELERKASTQTWTPKIVRPKAVSELMAQRFLKRTSIGVTSAMVLAWLVILLLPKPQPKTDELIPEQFAKVLLSPAFKQAGGQRRGGGGSGGGGTNVVQAFRSEAVQRTTKSLLNSRAAKSLLSGSTLLNTAASSAAARKVFDLKSAMGSKPVAPGKNLEVTSRQVGMLGGGKGGTGSGTGTGYGIGGGAGVEGQGAGLVDVEGAGLGVSEGLTKAEVGKVIRDHMTEVRYCYDAALIRNPGFEGKVVVSFLVRKNGGVSGVRVKEASGDKVLDACISQRLAKWKFPKPRGGVDVDISYPFIFKVLGN